jgi:osmotically inducible protein OsmC
MATSKASADWQGALKDGRGSEVPFSLGTRFEGAKGSNPEEMVGAALAGCFSMALTGSLSKAGLSPVSVHTDAEVSLEKQGEGFAITKITLTTRAQVPGIEPAKFESIAQETKKNCPVSKALAGTNIELKASLG